MILVKFQDTKLIYERSEREIKETHLLSSKRIKYLGISLPEQTTHQKRHTDGVVLKKKEKKKINKRKWQNRLCDSI